MVIKFAPGEPDDVLGKIYDVLGERPLSKIMSFELLDDQTQFNVTFSKVGTSRLVFSCDRSDKRILLELVKEKVALSHRPFYADVKKKMVNVLSKAGGEVTF